jgi:FkbM family methyltransferase
LKVLPDPLPPSTYSSEQAVVPPQADLLQIETSYGPLWTIPGDRGCSRTVQTYGDYSELEMDVMRKYVNAESVVVDVGANIGAFTIPLARIAKKVHAFEPQLDVINVLDKNIHENNLTNVTLWQYALGYKKEPATYNPRPESPGEVQIYAPSSSRIHESQGVETTLVLPLDSLNLTPDFIKIDAEGMEIDILIGGVETLKTHRPYLFMETQPDSEKDMIDILSQLHYWCFKFVIPIYLPNNRNKYPTNHHSGMAHMMMLAVPEGR